MVKAIVWDLGGVWGSNPPRNIIREIAVKHRLESKDIVKSWNKYWTKFVTGAITEEKFYENIIRDLHIGGLRRETINEFVEYSKLFTAIKPEEFAMIKKLKEVLGTEEEPIKFLLLTNTTKEWWGYFKKNRDFSVFDDIILSFEERMAKPTEALFKKVIEKIGEPGEEILFIDDKVSNCNAAERAGMQPMHFTTMDALIEQLHELNLMDEESYEELREGDKE